MNDKKTILTDLAIQYSLNIPDLTQLSSSGTSHAVRLMSLHILDSLVRCGWPQAEIHTGPRIVSAEDNYGLLGYDPTEVTLGSEHTRWVDQFRLLRTQTTSQIPEALQQAARLREAEQIVLLAAPGITFRRDTRDRWHCAEPHQMDVWVMGEPALATRANLLRLVTDILASAVPGKTWTYRTSLHHYTEGGIEVNVLESGREIEVLECGCIAGSLLQRLHIDPQEHGGLALGMGLDRLTMLRKGIPDIRLLRDANPRVQAQMFDLEPWKPVSRLPAISRDISLAVSPGQSEETLTEKMLNAVEEASGWIEEMRIKGRWSYEQLPAQAIERLGLLPGQENVLLQVVLRDFSRSITAVEANAVYEKIHQALHEGASGGGYRLR